MAEAQGLIHTEYLRLRLYYSSSIILVAWYELFCRNILSLCVCDISIADADMNANANHTPNLSTEFSPSLLYNVNEHLFTSTRYSQCRNVYSTVLVYLPSCILDMINMAARQTSCFLFFLFFVLGYLVSEFQLWRQSTEHALLLTASYCGHVHPILLSKNRYFSLNLQLKNTQMPILIFGGGGGGILLN